MKLGRAQPGKGDPGLSLILFRVSSHLLAVEAMQVDEIRDSEGLTPLFLPAAAAKVRFTFAKHGVDYFVVDAAYHYHLSAGRAQNLMVLRGLPVAVLAESIDRMCQAGPLLPLPAAFCGEERQWYRGLVVVDGAVVPVINTESFLGAVELEHLQRRAALQRGVAR
jgi:chemotaxis signal transduction protein